MDVAPSQMARGQIDCSLAAGQTIPIQWLVCTADGSPTAEGRPLAFLSSSERLILGDLRFAKRRREWLFGRWTAKHLIRSAHPPCRDLSPSSISIAADPDGAPFVSLEGEGRLPVSLSISHRQERALCAFAPQELSACGVGADVELEEPRSPTFVSDFFTPAEAESVRRAPQALQPRIACAIWSAKEAVLKTLREGLRVDTRRVEIVRLRDIERPLPERGPWDWREVSVRTALPNARLAGAWWTARHGYVYTLALNAGQVPWRA